jgi:AcrR family transcriptional regulator
MNIHSVVAYPDDPKSEAIMKAALELFVERGFHGTPVPDVAELAGVGAGTIYRTFESKEELVNKIYQRWKGEIATRLVDRFPADSPPREQFRIVWERMAEFAVAHPQELSFLELHHHGLYLDPLSRSIELKMHQFGELMVQRAQDAQAVKRLPPALLIELVNGAFLGVFRAAVEGRVPLTKESLMAAEQCCWEAIRA